MLEEVKGTLFDDVVSLNPKEKECLQNWSITAVNDVGNKRKENKRAIKTIVELIMVNEVTYQIIAVKKGSPKAVASVEDSIRSMNLNKEVIDGLIQKYDEGKITQNHIRDIKRTNNLPKMGDLDPINQKGITENTIINRNDYNDVNSSEISLVLIQHGMGDKNDIDNWYREMVRLIRRLTRYSDVKKEILNNLSVQQTEFLAKMISNLNVALEKLESGLAPEL